MSTRIVVTNEKGGVGKTPIVANVAGLAAARGIRTLVVDLDPQGNLAVDLGARSMAHRQQGRDLLSAVMAQSFLSVERAVRPRIDAVFAGSGTRQLADWFASTRSEDPTVLASVREALSTIENRYDLVLLDTPPAPNVMALAGMATADWLVAPSTGTGQRRRCRPPTPPGGSPRRGSTRR